MAAPPTWDRIVRANLHVHFFESSQQVVVVVNREGRMSFGGGRKRWVYPEVQDGSVALIPATATRGQDGRLGLRCKSQHADVELVAHVFGTGGNCELHVIEHPRHDNLQK